MFCLPTSVDPVFPAVSSEQSSSPQQKKGKRERRGESVRGKGPSSHSPGQGSPNPGQGPGRSTTVPQRIYPRELSDLGRRLEEQTDTFPLQCARRKIASGTRPSRSTYPGLTGPGPAPGWLQTSRPERPGPWTTTAAPRTTAGSAEGPSPTGARRAAAPRWPPRVAPRARPGPPASGEGGWGPRLGAPALPARRGPTGWAGARLAAPRGGPLSRGALRVTRAPLPAAAELPPPPGRPAWGPPRP